MADAFTTNLNLDKPVVGASSDAWGTSWNSNADALDAMLGGAIFGLTLSTAGSSSTFGIATGGASGMALASAYTKTTGSWAVGTGNGGLDTGSIANSTWYHVWLIQRADTGVVDVLISTSATSPTMPANYTRKRRIGAMLTNGSSQWTAFVQVGNYFQWLTPPIDANGVSVPTSTTSIALTVPSGVVVFPIFALRFGTSAGNLTIYLSNGGAASAGSIRVTQGTDRSSVVISTLATDTSKQIVWLADSGVTGSIQTSGWIDYRGAL